MKCFLGNFIKGGEVDGEINNLREIEVIWRGSILLLYISTFKLVQPVKMKDVAIVYILLKDAASFTFFWSRCEERGVCLFPKEHSVQEPLAAPGLIVGPVWNPNWLIQDRARITPLPPWILSFPTKGFL